MDGEKFKVVALATCVGFCVRVQKNEKEKEEEGQGGNPGSKFFSMPSSRRRVRVVDPFSDDDDEYSQASDRCVVLSKSALRELLNKDFIRSARGSAAKGKKGSKGTAKLSVQTASKSTTVPATSAVPETDSTVPPITTTAPKLLPKRGSALTQFPFKDPSPITSLGCPLPDPPVGPTKYWRLPPRFQIKRAKKVFNEYSLNNPKSRGRQGNLRMEVADLLPAMKELFGEGWMKHCPGGLRWWVVGVTNGDVEGFLDGRKFEGGMQEGEFVEICAVTSEGILTKETKVEEVELEDDGDDDDGGDDDYDDDDAVKEEDRYLDDLDDDLDDLEDDDLDDEEIVILRSKPHHGRYRRDRNRHRGRHQKHHHHHQRKKHHHHRHHPEEADPDSALEEFVTRELVRRSKSPLRHYIRQAREETEAAADENELWLQGNAKLPAKPKEKPVAWSIPAEGEGEGEVEEGGRTVDREAEVSAFLDRRKRTFPTTNPSPLPRFRRRPRTSSGTSSRRTFPRASALRPRSPPATSQVSPPPPSSRPFATRSSPRTPRATTMAA